jgi:sugar phosphate isomerase/epimerase
MKLQLYKSLWGVVQRDGGTKTLVEALTPLKQQGYTGVECSVRLAHDLDSHEGGFAAALAEHGLAWVSVPHCYHTTARAPLS